MTEMQVHEERVMNLVESSSDNPTITPLTKTNAHRAESIRRIGTDKDAVAFHFRKKSKGMYMYMYIHTYTENGEEKELRASDFKNWEVTGFKYPGYLEEQEEIAVNAYRWNSHDPETRAETDIMGYEKQLHEDLKKIPEAKKQDYINTYKSKISVLFHSLSRCANPMVTGRGGFNFQRNEKAQNAYQNRYDEFLKWREKFLKTMQLLTEKDRPEEEKREETWRRLKRDIASSANTIHEIDTGKARGYNRALFVSSIFNKVSTFASHGDVEIVQRAINFISEYNAGIKKPVITPRHQFFQLAETASRMRNKLKETKEQENNPFLVAVTRNVIHKRSRIHDKSLCRPFREITEENYYNCMNELPPVRLKRHSFFFGEPYHSSLYMFCFTIGKRFFRGLRPVMTPQAELERQMNEHYRNIIFKGKVTKGKAERITSKDKQEIITIPYSFTDKENRERFICNMVTGGNDGRDTCKARKDMANILLSLRKHHFLYFSGYGRHDDMETLLDEVEEKRYTIIASGCLFQFPPCRDSVSFTGTVKETGENFFYRIYDRELFLHIMHRLRAVKREKTPAEAKAILPKCKRYE